MVDVKEALRESAKFTLELSLQLRLKYLEKMTAGCDSLANRRDVDSHWSSGEGWKGKLRNGVEYDRVLTGAVKFTLQVELDDSYIAQGHADIFVPQHLHECRQADPETHHFCCEGVTKPVRIYPAGAPSSPGGLG